MNILKINFLILITLSPLAVADESNSLQRPLALIYKGPGSCSADQGDAGDSGYGCSEASADVATAAGFQVKYVGPKALPENATAAQVQAIFGEAKVWIQPGGIAQMALYSMTNKLRKELVKFVSNGGGYVGFCAGAFIATAYISTSGDPGLGIFPGYTAGYRYTPERYDVGYSFEPMMWSGKKRSVFFEGGPYMYGYGSKAETTAVFDTGYTAAARAPYGNGRVYITGAHPEAPPIWSEEDGLHDPDGVDYGVGADMVRWAAGLK